MPRHEIQTKTGRPLFESMIEASNSIRKAHVICDVCGCKLSRYESQKPIPLTKQIICAECLIGWYDWIVYEP